MSSDIEEKILKAIQEERKAGARGIRFQLLSLKTMSATMDELFSILKKMKESGTINFGGPEGPTAEVPANWKPDIMIYPL